MNFDEYQEKAMETNFSNELPDDCNPLLYYSLKLCGEAGEIAEKIGKLFRDRKGVYDQAFIDDIEKELGDCFWYQGAIAKHFGVLLSSVATTNIAKLKSRQERGVLGGSGDNR